jgi:hypothetical protein
MADIKPKWDHNNIMEFSTALSIASLMLSMVAIIIAAYMSVRQVRLMRHANELPAFVDLLQEYRSGDLYVIQSFILNDLGEYSAERGYSGLPALQRKQFLTMLDYMTSMACLVGFDIVGINHIFAMYGYLFQNMWNQMRPFVEKERERTGHDIGYIVEDLCRKLSKVDPKRFRRDLRLLDDAGRTFPRWRPFNSGNPR